MIYKDKIESFEREINKLVNKDGYDPEWDTFKITPKGYCIILTKYDLRKNKPK